MSTIKPEQYSDTIDHTLEHPEDTQQSAQPIEQAQPAATAPTSERPMTKEQAFEQYKQVDEVKPEESPYVVRQASHQPVDQVMTGDTHKSATQIAIENIMADGLDTVYQAMPPADQQQFRQRGEAVAKNIADLTTRLKLTARKVLHLIRGWLKLIPGINKFFLEQAAKLKTDDIMKYSDHQMLKKRYYF